MIEIRNEQLGVFRSQARMGLQEKIRGNLSEQGQDIRCTGNNLAICEVYGNATTLSFQDDDLPEELVSPSGLAYSFEHNPSGTLAAITYPSGRRLDFDRDAHDDVTAIRQPGLGEYQFALSKLADDSTLLQSVTYPDQRQRAIEYDESGHLVAVDRNGECISLLTG